MDEIDWMQSFMNAWNDPSKTEPKKSKHYVVHVSIKEVEATEGSATERTIRTLISSTSTGQYIEPLLKAARDMVFIAEEQEQSLKT